MKKPTAKAKTQTAETPPQPTNTEPHIETGGGTTFNAYDWYWLADDGRVFASARQISIDEGDADYVAWIEVNTPTIWPRDDAGNQTDAALQDVLKPYGIFVNDTYAARDELSKAIDSGFTCTVASAPGGFTAMTAQYNRTEINIAAIRAGNDSQYSTIWFGADGVGYPITNSEIKNNLSNGLSQHMQACYDAYNAAIEGLNSGKITKREQVTKLFAKFKRDVSQW